MTAKKTVIAFDTSNYTTSCAVFDGENGLNSSRLLDVSPGKLGLRQSEALFAHVKNLPSVMEKLEMSGEIIAVGASSKPRETEGSYMPCFLAGASQAAVLSKAMKIPYYEFSHQQGHIAAALWSAGRLELMEREHLAWHLSGGTTELLLVKPCGVSVKCEIIGGTSDVSAGQLVDRTGVLLGLDFPAGRWVDELSRESRGTERYEPKLNGLGFSLSGVEHKMKGMIEKGAKRCDTARFAIESLICAVLRTTERAKQKYGDMPVLFSGGVSSNSLLREKISDGIFAERQYSTDNAMGTAILTYRAVNADG